MLNISLRLAMALAIAGALAAPAALAQSSAGNPRKPDGTVQKPGSPAGTDTYGACSYSYVWTNVTTKGTVSTKSGYIRRTLLDTTCPSTNVGPGMVE